jgi:hypothetical protein
MGQLDESAMFCTRQRGFRKRSQSFINVRVLSAIISIKIPELKQGITKLSLTD